MINAFPVAGSRPALHPSAPIEGAQGGEGPAVVSRTAGQIVHIAEIARDVIELVIVPAKPMARLAGQYFRFSFRGYPARPFSPTCALSRITEDGKLRLNIRRVRDGRVTPHLGRSIRTGHDVEIEGPFGGALAVPVEDTNRLVLVGSETGFAPVWSLTAALLRRAPDREIVLVAASRTLDAFYMTPALSLASRYPRVSIVAVVEELSVPWSGLLPGSLFDHLPVLTATDIVCAAGGRDMIVALADMAADAGAAFHADPFCPPPPRTRWLDSARSWLKAG